MRSLTSFIRPLRGIPNSMSSPALTRYQPIPMTTPGGGVSGIHISNLSSSSTKSLLKNLDDAHAQVISFRCRLPERSRQLLDKGALQDLDADSKGRLIAPHFTKIMNNTSEGAERHETVVAFNVMLRHLHVARKRLLNVYILGIDVFVIEYNVQQLQKVRRFIYFNVILNMVDQIIVVHYYV